MATNVQYYESVLKEIYDGYIRDNATKKTVLLGELERTKDFTVDVPNGRYYYVPAVLGLPQGVNTTGEYGPLPESGRSVTAGATYFSVQHTGTVKFSFRAQNAGKGDRAGWMDIPSMEMDNVVSSLRQSMNRQMFGDGSGIIAQCSAMGVAGNNIPVDTTKWIYAHATNGMYVDIVDRNTGTKLAEKRMVTAKTATQITIAGAAIQTTANHVVTPYGSFNSEVSGLDLITGNGVLGGIDPSVPGQEAWSGISIDAQGKGPSLPLFQQPFDIIEDNNGEVKFIVCSTGVRTAAANYLTSWRRIPVDSGTVTLPGGFKGVDWNGVALVRDKDCAPGTAVFIDTDAIKIGELHPGTWQDLGQGIIHWDGGRGYQAVWIWDMNVLTFYRNRIVKMYNIAEV